MNSTRHSSISTSLPGWQRQFQGQVPDKANAQAHSPELSNGFCPIPHTEESMKFFSTVPLLKSVSNSCSNGTRLCEKIHLVRLQQPTVSQDLSVLFLSLQVTRCVPTAKSLQGAFVKVGQPPGYFMRSHWKRLGRSDILPFLYPILPFYIKDDKKFEQHTEIQTFAVCQAQVSIQWLSILTQG